MCDASLQDLMLTARHDPLYGIHMGITAENVAAQFHITRRMMGKLALTSHQRASAAIAAGCFREQIVPASVPTRKGSVVFDTAEHVRPDTTLEVLSVMKPAFEKACGSVTAGSSCGINDGAASVVLAGAEAARDRGLEPMARLLGYAHAGVDPTLMGIGPVPATRKVLARVGLSVADPDVIESNEAFAAQACAGSRTLGFDPARVNPNGSGISLDHPIGATGAIVTTKTIHELRRIGGGQGFADVFERV